MIDLGVFHHFGIATESIARDEATFLELGYSPESSPFIDEAQGIRGVFMTGPGPRLELLEPFGGSPTLEPWLTSGSRIYHQAFEVDDLAQAVAQVSETKVARLLRKPTPASAFQGRSIAFVMLRNHLVIELIQAGKK